MKFSKKDLKEFAQLALIDLQESDLESFLPEFQELVDFFANLEDVSQIQIDAIRSVKENLSFLSFHLVPREDEEDVSLRIDGETFLDQAPQSDGGYLILDQFFEHSE